MPSIAKPLMHRKDKNMQIVTHLLVRLAMVSLIAINAMISKVFWSLPLIILPNDWYLWMNIRTGSLMQTIVPCVIWLWFFWGSAKLISLSLIRRSQLNCDKDIDTGLKVWILTPLLPFMKLNLSKPYFPLPTASNENGV